STTPASLDASVGLAGQPALVYNGDTVNVHPIIETLFQVDPTNPTNNVPTEIKVQLTWNKGTPQNWVTFSTTGHSDGDVYLLDVQAANTVTQTRSYPWKIEVQATLQDSSVIHFIHTGSTLVVVNDNPLSPNPFGNGWSLAGVDQLLTDTN